MPQLPRRASGRQAPEGVEQDRRAGEGARARPRLRRVPRNVPTHNEVVLLSPRRHHRSIPAVKQGAVGRNDGTALAHPRRATSRPPAACTWPPHLPRPRRLERPARERTERPGAPTAPTASLSTSSHTAPDSHCTRYSLTPLPAGRLTRIGLTSSSKTSSAPSPSAESTAAIFNFFLRGIPRACNQRAGRSTWEAERHTN